MFDNKHFPTAWPLNLFSLKTLDPYKWVEPRSDELVVGAPITMCSEVSQSLTGPFGVVIVAIIAIHKTVELTG